MSVLRTSLVALVAGLVGGLMGPGVWDGGPSVGAGGAYGCTLLG